MRQLTLLVACLALVAERGAAQDCATRPSSATTPSDVMPFDTVIGASEAALAGLTDLRDTALSEADLELRLWYGDGPVRPTGLVLRRTSGMWHAVQYAYDRSNRCLMPASLDPAIDWSAVWQQVEAEQALNLPTEPSRAHVIDDGTFYSLEVKIGAAYHAVSYGNPEAHDTPEDQRVLRVVTALLRPLRPAADIQR